MYLAVVLTVLLYACESWTVYSRHARKRNHFHSNCLRIILSIKWQDMVPDTEVLTRAGILSIHTLRQKAQVRWAGHVTRMHDDRLPKQLLYGEHCYGKRSVGGQKKRFKDTLKKPSQASISMSPTGKSVPMIDPFGAVRFIPEQKQQNQTGSQRLRKSVLLAKRDYTLSQSRATSGPRARSGPRRPSVRPATLLGNNIAIRPAKSQPTKAGFMSEITSRECTNSEHFGRPREQRCTLRRLLIKYKNAKSRCRQTNSNNYNVGLSHALAYLQRAQVTVSHNPISSS